MTQKREQLYGIKSLEKDLCKQSLIDIYTFEIKRFKEREIKQGTLKDCDVVIKVPDGVNTINEHTLDVYIDKERIKHWKRGMLMGMGLATLIVGIFYLGWR